MKNFNKITISSFLALILILAGLFMAGNALASPDKEYRTGQIISINNKNYLIASNNEFAEIIEIQADNKMVQVSEVHGSGPITDLYAGQYLNKYFLVTATGRYLYRYDISDPKSPKIEFRRDLYTFRRGEFRIGSVNMLAGNQDYLFTAGSNGVRSFLKDSLFVYKIFNFDKAYGLAADFQSLYVMTETKGLVYDIISGNKLAEVAIDNKDKTYRSPFFDDLGYAYFPSDKGLFRVFRDTNKVYFNPPAQDFENYSYGVTSLSGGSIYYVNGHGITVFDKNFNKTKFVNTSKNNLYGDNSWAVGITSAKIGSREIIADFNKSSILLMDKNLKVLSQYKYKRSYPEFITQDLKILASSHRDNSGQKVNIQLFGFWPNENVAVTFGNNNYSLKVDNQGFGKVEISVPYQTGQNAVIQAVGNDSKFSYQTSFVIL
jgi:hypothetical protein